MNANNARRLRIKRKAPQSIVANLPELEFMRETIVPPMNNMTNMAPMKPDIRPKMNGTTRGGCGGLKSSNCDMALSPDR